MPGPQNSYTSGTRIGNWVEEDQLQRLTGTRTYVRPKKGVNERTAARVIVHSDAQPASQWRSTNKMPVPVVPHHAKYGTRQARRLAAAEAAVRAEMDAEDAVAAAERTKGRFLSEEQEAFAPRPNSFSNVGKRVMKTQSGLAPLPMDAAMYEFNLHERPPTLPPSVLAAQVPETDYKTEMPITVYTQQLNAGKVYASGGAPSWAPFNKNTAFTNDIMDSRKVHAEAIDSLDGMPPGAAVYVRPSAKGCTLEAIDIFAAVIEKLTAAGSPNGLRSLAALFPGGAVAPLVLRGALKAQRIELSATQLATIRRQLTGRDGLVRFADVRRIVGVRALQGRRLALVSGAFNVLDFDGVGSIPFGKVPAFADASWGKAPGTVVTRAEFEAYFEDAGVRLSNDAFERMLVKGWEIPRSDIVWREGSCMRVVATLRSGKEVEVEIPDAAAIGDTAWGKIRACLHRQGCHGVTAILFKGRKKTF